MIGTKNKSLADRGNVLAFYVRATERDYPLLLIKHTGSDTYIWTSVGDMGGRISQQSPEGESVIITNVVGTHYSYHESGMVHLRADLSSSGRRRRTLSTGKVCAVTDIETWRQLMVARADFVPAGRGEHRDTGPWRTAKRYTLRRENFDNAEGVYLNVFIAKPTHVQQLRDGYAQTWTIRRKPLVLVVRAEVANG